MTYQGPYEPKFESTSVIDRAPEPRSVTGRLRYESKNFSPPDLDTTGYALGTRCVPLARERYSERSTLHDTHILRVTENSRIMFFLTFYGVIEK